MTHKFKEPNFWFYKLGDQADIPDKFEDEPCILLFIKIRMLNVYRVIGPTPSFPLAHTALASGKTHTDAREMDSCMVQACNSSKMMNDCIFAFA